MMTLENILVVVLSVLNAVLWTWVFIALASL